ncbi:MAG: hypothetical protein ACTHV2_13315 [Brachybacterium sp.]
MSPTAPLGSESRLPAAWRPWRRPSPLAERGIGIANLVGRTTARAAQLTRAELRAGGRRLIRRAAVLPAALRRRGGGHHRMPSGLRPSRCGARGAAGGR